MHAHKRERASGYKRPGGPPAPNPTHHPLTNPSPNLPLPAPAVYTNSDDASVPITREVLSGRGKEARSYIAAILEHWDDLPDAIAFMHAHRWVCVASSVAVGQAVSSNKQQAGGRGGGGICRDSVGRVGRAANCGSVRCSPCTAWDGTRPAAVPVCTQRGGMGRVLWAA